MTSTDIVTGAGPVGTAVALHLAEQGRGVRVLTRSGSGPDHPLIERIAVDVSDPAALDQALTGLNADGLDANAALYHCIHGSAYRADTWTRELPAAEQVVLDAAGRRGAAVVFPESLYAYDASIQPMTEDSPRTRTTGKGGVRTALLAARAASPTRTASVVASDFFGPHVLAAHAGERMIPLILAGKTVRVMGALDVPHSFTFVPDLAAAMVAAAHNPQLWDGTDLVLHAPTNPPLTQRELVTALATAADVPVPKMGLLPSWLLRGVGQVHQGTKELAEMLYQFESPFIIDSTASEQRLNLTPTPLPEALAQTVRWWRTR